MEQQILIIIVILLGLGLIAVTLYAVKLLIGIQKNLTQEFVEKYAAKVIAAIAQKYGTLENEQKFAKAVSLLKDKFGVNYLTASELEILIENEVAKLKITGCI